MARWLAVLGAWVLTCAVYGQAPSVTPEPKQLQTLAGRFAFRPGLALGLASPSRDRGLADQLGREVGRCFNLALAPTDLRSAPLALGLLSDAGLQPLLAGENLAPLQAHGGDAYLLRVTPQGILIAGKGSAGAFNALLTLGQILRQAAEDGSIPCCRILDWPTPRPGRKPAPVAAAPSPAPTAPRPPTPPPADRKWTFTFTAADHARFASALAPLVAAGEVFGPHPAPGVGPSDFLTYTVLSPAPPGGRMQRNRNSVITPSWSAGVKILRYPTDAEAGVRWRAGVIGTNIIGYRRDELDARRSSLQGQGLGGTVTVTDEQITDWNATYLTWYYGGPIRNPDPRYKYWVEYGLRLVCLYKNCLLEAGAGRIDQFQGADRPTPAMLRADANQLLQVAKALVDEKRGERPAAPAPVAAQPPPVAPATVSPAAEEVDTAYLDRRWLSSLLDAMAAAERRMAQTRALIAVQRLAAARLREHIQHLELLLTKDPATGDDPFEWFATRWDAAWGQAPPVPATGDVKAGLRAQIEASRQELQGVLQEQDETIAAMRATYGSLLDEIRLVGDRCPTTAVRDSSAALRQQVSLQMDMAELELSFASGQREKFRALARSYVDGGKYVPLVRLMEGFDDLEHGENRGALRALKLCLEADPKNATATTMVKRLEVGYLRAIDAKVMGEAAEVRERCWDRLKQRGEEGFFGALFDVLGSGPANSINEAWNEESVARAEEAGTLQMDAATTHGGLLLISRLRERDLSLAEIRGLSSAQLTQRVKQLFQRDLQPVDALRLRTAMMAAFRNPDLARLSSGGREQLDVDTGRSYTEAGVFDETWGEWIGDCVNVKNVVTMAGPAAVYTQGGKLAWFRVATQGEKAGEILTLKDACAGAMGLPELTKAAARSKYGQLWMQRLTDFSQGTGVVSQMLAEALVQQGIVQAASMVGSGVGGELGDRLAVLAADLITSYGVGDINLAVKLIERSGGTPHQVRFLANRLRDMAKDLEPTGALAVPKQRFAAAVDRLAAGQALTPADLKALEEGAQLAAQMKRALADKAANAPTPGVVQRQQAAIALADGLQQVKQGQVAAAQVSASFLEACEDLQARNRQRCADLAKQCDGLAAGMAREGAAPSGPAAEATVLALGGEVPVASGRVRLDATKGHGLLETMDYASPQSCTRIADRYVRTGNYDKALAHYDGLIEHVRQIKDATPEWKQRALGFLNRRRELAAQGRQARALFAATTDPANAAVKTAVTPGELAMMRADPTFALKPMEGPATLTSPLWVTVGGRRVGVFKPQAAGAAAGAAEAEVEATFHALGELFDVPVAASARTTMRVGAAEVPGTFIRYVDGTELKDCAVGQILAVKEQVARARVLRVFLGDYDLQSRNLRVAANGAVFDLDHGQADLLGSVPDGVSAEQMEEVLRRQMQWCANSNDSPQAVTRQIYQLVGAVERQVDYAQVEGLITQIKAAVQDGSLERALRPVHGAQTGKLMEVLRVRANLLEEVFRDAKFRVVPPRGAAALPDWSLAA